MNLYFKLIFIASCWGGTFIAGRILSADVQPFSAGFLRFIFASSFLFIFTADKRDLIPVLSFKKWAGVVLLAFTGVFAYTFFFLEGLHTVEAGRAATIIANNPVFIALLAAVIFKESLSLLKIVGILVAFSGAVIAITHGNPLTLFTDSLSRGDYLIFGAVVSWVSYSLLGKYMISYIKPSQAVFLSCLIGAFLLLPCAVYEGMLSNIIHYSWMSWLAIIYLGLFGTALSFVMYYEVIADVGAARAGVCISMVPVVSILSGWVILGEELSASIIAGALLVISGVFLVNNNWTAKKAVTFD